MINEGLKALAGSLHGPNIDTLAMVAQLVFNAFCNVWIIQQVSLRCGLGGVDHDLGGVR